MKLSTTLTQALSFAALSQASRIAVSSYSGNVTIIDIAERDGPFNLSILAHSPACGIDPSWLEYDGKTSTLYCAAESWNTPDNATFSSFQIQTDGNLTSLSNVTTLNGGVNTVQLCSWD